MQWKNEIKSNKKKKYNIELNWFRFASFHFLFSVTQCRLVDPHQMHTHTHTYDFQFELILQNNGKIMRLFVVISNLTLLLIAF